MKQFGCWGLRSFWRQRDNGRPIEQRYTPKRPSWFRTFPKKPKIQPWLQQEIGQRKRWPIFWPRREMKMRSLLRSSRTPQWRPYKMIQASRQLSQHTKMHAGGYLRKPGIGGFGVCRRDQLHHLSSTTRGKVLALARDTTRAKGEVLSIVVAEHCRTKL